MYEIIDTPNTNMSSVFDISGFPAYRGGMIKIEVRKFVSGISAFIDTLPDPLVLRAMDVPQKSTRQIR